MENMAILYGVPKVAYGLGGCTPFPLCVNACAEYLGVQTDYARIMAESGAAFRLTWDTSCWNGGNVDVIFTYDDPAKIYRNGLRAMHREFRMLGRSPEMKKEEFKEFICAEVAAGYPVIALGIIGPPEACVIAGYRDGGNTLMGWNVFQEDPEHRAHVRFMENGYFLTESWWENPDTLALFATGGKEAAPPVPVEVLRNATEVLEGRMCGKYAKGLMAYDAWKDALLCEREFPRGAVIPLLVERMICQGDAMNCIADGRHNASEYLRMLAAEYPDYSEKLRAAALEFESMLLLVKEMSTQLGGWGFEEERLRRLADQGVRKEFAEIIDCMKVHDGRALEYMRAVSADIENGAK